MPKKWWREGVRFQCQGSGNCCTSHGEFGFVFLTKEDRQRFAKHFKMTLDEFTKAYCTKTDKTYSLNERPDNPDCIFLKDKRCSVYEARPTQCRTWPFWPEVMPAKAWSKDVAAFCPGVGKGPVIPFEKIEAELAEQINAELEY
jgi:Fe-S-cluster containining protein